MLVRINQRLKFSLRCFFLVLLCVVLFFQSVEIFRYSQRLRKAFVEVGFDYQKIVNRTWRSRVIYHAKLFLPDGTDVQITEPLNLTRIALRYKIFPHRVVDQAPFVIDLTGSPPPSKEWKKKDLGDGGTLFAAPGYDFVNKSPPRLPSGLPGVLVPVFLAVFLCCVGTMVLKRLGYGGFNQRPLWFLSTGYLTGFVIVTAGVWVYLLLGGTLSPGAVMIPLVVCSGLVFLLPQKKCFPVYNVDGSGQKDNPAIRAGLLFPIAAIFVVTVYFPVLDWDGMSHWIMKSKVMYFSKGLDFSYTHHNIYPLLWPLNVAIQFVLSGGMSDGPAKWTAGILFLAFFLQIVEVLRTVGIKSAWALPTTVLFIMVAFRDPLGGYYLEGFIHANAENIFLVFLAAAAGAVVLWQKERNFRSLVLLGVLSTGLGLAKFEGWVAVLCMAIALLAVKYREHNKRWALVFIPGIFLPLLWAAWIKHHGFVDQHIHFQEIPTLGKALFLLRFCLKYSLYHNMTLVVLVSLGYLALFGRRGRLSEAETFLLVFSVFLMGFSVFAYVGLPVEAIKIGVPEAFPRLFLHAMPPYFLFWCSRCLASAEQPSGAS